MSVIYVTDMYYNFSRQFLKKPTHNPVYFVAVLARNRRGKLFMSVPIKNRREIPTIFYPNPALFSVLFFRSPLNFSTLKP